MLICVLGAEINHISKDGEAPITLAVRSGDLKMVHLLFYRGAHALPNLLMIACVHGHFKVVKYCIQHSTHGMNPNAVVNGRQILEWAVMSGSFELVSMK